MKNLYIDYNKEVLTDFIVSKKKFDIPEEKLFQWIYWIECSREAFSINEDDLRTIFKGKIAKDIDRSWINLLTTPIYYYESFILYWNLNKTEEDLKKEIEYKTKKNPEELLKGFNKEILENTLEMATNCFKQFFSKETMKSILLFKNKNELDDLMHSWMVSLRLLDKKIINTTFRTQDQILSSALTSDIYFSSIFVFDKLNKEAIQVILTGETGKFKNPSLCERAEYWSQNDSKEFLKKKSNKEEVKKEIESNPYVSKKALISLLREEILRYLVSAYTFSYK